MSTEIKNMAYWKAKNTLPGINPNSEGNTDTTGGRSGSSPFQENGDDDILSHSQKLDAKAQNLISSAQKGVVEDSSETKKAMQRKIIVQSYNTPRRDLKKELKNIRQSGDKKGTGWFARTFKPKEKLRSTVVGKTIKDIIGTGQEAKVLFPGKSST